MKVQYTAESGCASFPKYTLFLKICGQGKDLELCLVHSSFFKTPNRHKKVKLSEFCCIQSFVMPLCHVQRLHMRTNAKRLFFNVPFTVAVNLFVGLILEAVGRRWRSLLRIYLFNPQNSLVQTGLHRLEQRCSALQHLIVSAKVKQDP